MDEVSAAFAKYGPLREVKLLKGYVCRRPHQLNTLITL